MEFDNEEKKNKRSWVLWSSGRPGDFKSPSVQESLLGKDGLKETIKSSDQIRALALRSILRKMYSMLL